MSTNRFPRTRLSVEELEGRLPPANDLFAVPAADADGGPVALRFEWGAGSAAFKNEVGVFAVDDGEGRVNGLLPTDAGYAGQALLRAQVVFARGAGKGAKNELSLPGGQLIGLYIVSNNTTQAALAGRANVFFSLDAANSDRVDHVQTRNRGDGGRDFRFEDTFGGGDLDYNDAVISVTQTKAVAAPGATGQSVQANFTRVSRDAGYKNEVGLFKVDARDGRIGDLKPGDAGYLDAALRSGTRQIIFSDTANPGVTTQTLTLDGGGLYGFYIVANGTADELLARNPGNAPASGPLAYFSFVDANPDGLEHLDWRGENLFGLEDLPGGGDEDFNDMVIAYSFGEPQGTPTNPEQPPAVDTEPPATAFALVADTGVSNADLLTNDPRVNVTVTDASPVTRLRAGFDSAAPADYTDVLPSLAGDGTLTLTGELIRTINRGAPLDDGQHTLFLEVADAAGNSDLRQFTFTLDATAAPVTFTLDAASDSGDKGDFRTGLPTANLTGTTEAGVTVQVFEFSRATGAETLRGTTTAGAGGAFRFDGLSLDLGNNIYRVRTTDAAGNAASAEQTVTRTQAPTVTAGANLSPTVQVGATTTVDLRTIFDTIVRMETSEGDIDVTLFEETQPLTVANFLNYVNGTTVNGGNYDNTIFHRLDEGFVLQGGGFRFNDAANTFTAITKDPAVVNEPGISNTRGTIAMAKLGGDPNSATDEFFFNLGNNTFLDTQNGGFTVFGRVSVAGQAVLDAVEANFTEYAGNPPATPTDLPGAPPFPVRNGTNTANFPANVSLAQMVQLFGGVTLTDPLQLTFSVTSADPTVATATTNGTNLLITGVSAGTTTITLTAKDADESVRTVTFNVTVS